MSVVQPDERDHRCGQSQQTILEDEPRSSMNDFAKAEGKKGHLENRAASAVVAMS